MTRRWLGVGIVIAIALGARLMFVPETPSPSPPRPLGPGERWLPVADWSEHILCSGVGYRYGFVILHGSPDDPRMAWMTFPDGTRNELAWPLGYSARFDPSLEILDELDRVIGHEGSAVTGGCPIGGTGAMSIELTTPQPPNTPPPDVRTRTGPERIH